MIICNDLKTLNRNVVALRARKTVDTRWCSGSRPKSSLDDEQLELVADRIKTLLEDANAEIKRTKDLNVTGRLEAVYDEIKLLVDELQ